MGDRLTLDLRDDVIKPLPSQLAFLKAVRYYEYTLFGGAAGPGKSYILRWALVDLLLYWLKKLGLQGVCVGLFCENYPSLKDRQISKIERQFPQWLGRVQDTQSEGLCFFLHEDYGGGRIALRNLDDPAKYACCTEETDVLVRGKGFIPIASCNVGDECLSFDPTTKAMSWQTATAVHRYAYEGDVLEYHSRFGPSYAVTPNHMMWYRTRRKTRFDHRRAEHLPATYCVPRVGSWDHVYAPHDDAMVFHSDGNNGKTLHWTLPVFLKFLGLYLAEGSCDTSRWSIRIAQSSHSTYRPMMTALLTQMAVNFSETPTGYSFNNKALVQYLKQFGIAREKFIPQAFKDLPCEYLEELFTGLLWGDGSKVRDGKQIYTTTSPRLRDDVMEVALKLGYVPTTYTYPSRAKVYPNGKTYQQSEYYHVTLTKRHPETRCRLPQRRPYQGLVACPTVPPHHTICIRHRGRVMFIGQSAEFAAIAVDELTKNPRNVFDDLRFRKRWPGIEHSPFLAASNPGSVGHQWVKKLWVDRDFSGDDAALSPEHFCFIPAKAGENPYLPQSYRETLHSLPLAMRKAMEEGNWDLFAGQYFEEWNRVLHVCEPFSIPWRWRRLISLDYGYENPSSVGWWAVDDQGEWYRYRELYQTKLTYAMLAQEIMERTPLDEDIYAVIADPSVWGDRPHHGETVGEVGGEVLAVRFRVREWPLIRANNDRLQGWQRCRELLRPVELPDGKRKGKLHIFSTCANFLRTVPAMVHDPVRVEDLDTDAEDHVADEWRYAVNTKLALSTPSRHRVKIRERPSATALVG